jgi:hypothetical protein
MASVDDELGATLEHVDQSDGTVGADQRVVGELDHRQPATLGRDGVELTGRGLLSDRRSSSAARQVGSSTIGGRAVAVLLVMVSPSVRMNRFVLRHG